MDMSGPMWSSRKGIPLYTIGVMVLVVLSGLYQATDSIRRVSRQAALSTQLYEDSLVADYEEQQKLKQMAAEAVAASLELPVESEAAYIPIDPDVERRIAFVHVGKSGGR